LPLVGETTGERWFQSSYGGFGTGGADEITTNSAGYKSQHDGDHDAGELRFGNAGDDKDGDNPPNNPGMP